MIYSWAGCELELSRRVSENIIEAKRLDDGAVKQYYIHQLKADGGIKEIEKAVNALGGK